MRFKLLTTFEEFLLLKEQWNRLVEATDVDHAFMKHEWFECWIKNLMPEGKLVVHTAWENDRLVAVAPLQIVWQSRKKIPLRILSFLRSSITPRSNFIIDNSIDSNAFFDSLFAIGGWDIAEFKAMEAGIPATAKFMDYVEKNLNFVTEDGLQSPFEVNETDWETYLKSKSKNYRKNYRNYLNRLQNEGEYKILKVENSSDFERWFESLVEVSGRSWKFAEKTDLKSMPQVADFYRDFSILTAESGLFVAYLLVIKEKLAAFSYYLRHRNRLVGIRWEYDEEYAYFMPGIVLHNYCLKDSIDSGQKWEYDLSGMVTEHKGRLAEQIRKHIDVTVGRPGLLGKLIMFFKRLPLSARTVKHDTAAS
ncbi:MAG: GNAT family N-acetyltransferase [Candidatus Zixiibacteriota bacterium]